MTQKERDTIEVITSIRTKLDAISNMISNLASSIADDFPNASSDLYSALDTLHDAEDTLETRIVTPLNCPRP